MNEDLTSEQQTFIEQVNNTPKEFSHNKLQLTIETLENDLKKLHELNSEKDMQISLLKATIESLQAETKAQSSEIETLQKLVSEKDSVIKSNQSLLDTEKSKSTDISSSNLKLNEEISELQKQLRLSQDENFDLKRNTNNITFELSELKRNMDTQAATINSQNDISKEWVSKLNTLQNIHDQTCKELDTLKLELAEFKTQNLSLQETLDNKSLELTETETQLKRHLQHQTPPPQSSSSLAGRTRRIINKRR
jgi:chromosome segregation ATPase